MIGTVPQGGVSPEEIGEALSRVMASEPFSNSKRLQRFLAHVVEKTVAGETEALKEYGIALAVFDRETSFDPRMDSIVRVEARRLRQQLEAYYRVAGAQDPVVIELPKGAYVPIFGRRGEAETERLVLAAAPDETPTGPAASPKRRPVTIYAVGAGLVLALCGWLAWNARPRVPHSWRVEGTKLVVVDARQRVCWEKVFPAFRADYSEFVQDKALVADIDGDGRPEVLFSLHPASQGERGDTLFCYDDRGNTRWEYHYGGRRAFGARSFDASYVGRFARLVESRGRRYVLTVANHHIWYPAQAALLDPATGRVVEEYWHPGSIYQLALEDVDGDGRREVLLGAINNPGEGLGHTALAVLKIPFSDAPRRAAAGAAFAPATGGGELAYILFPQPDVNRVMGTFPIPARMMVDQNRRIVVQTPLPEIGGIVYYLDFHLNVQEFRCSDNFIALHERYRKQHLLDHIFGAEEAAALGRVARFDAAPDGNSPAVARIWP